MAFFYIRDSSIRRETTKSEMEVMEVQMPGRFDIMPLNIGVQFPVRDEGEDGDYYALLYPVGWEGKVWSGTG